MIRTLTFFSWRFLRTTQTKGSLCTLVKISFGAIMLGTFCLTLVAAIMYGFKQATYTTLQNIHPDLIMEADYTQNLNVDAITQALQKEFPTVIAVAPRASNFIIVEKKYENSVQQYIVMLQAFDPHKEVKTTHIEKTLQNPREGTLKNLIVDDAIVIGSKLAENLGIYIGDILTLYYATDQTTKSQTITFQTYQVSVAGIFSTGIADYDSQVIWGSFNLFNTLFEEGVTSLGLRLAPYTDHKQVLESLQKRFGLSISPWYNLYPALLQALQLEEYAMFIILFFIVVLAALTMASTLMLHIEHKRIDIALLQAMGMSNYMVEYIFITMGVGIALSATCCGMISGWSASWLINTYKLIVLPDAYYISYLPAFLTPYYFLFLFLIACIISLVVVIYAVRKSQTHSISTILRGQTL